MGIKFQAGKAALLQEFFLCTTATVEQNGKGKFIPVGLANVLGKDAMQTIIRQNNQYLKTLTSIPINRLLPQALQVKIPINDEVPEAEQEKTTMHNYITNADWCHGLEPTNTKGKYYLITMYNPLARPASGLTPILKTCLPNIFLTMVNLPLWKDTNSQKELINHGFCHKTSHTADTCLLLQQTKSDPFAK